MRQLLLVRHAPSIATRDGALPGDEPLDAAALAQASLLRHLLPAACGAICSPARRCVQTAQAAGLHPELVPALRECDFGTWTGRTLAQLNFEDPDATRSWMTDPDANPHAGESLTEFNARVAVWLDGEASRAEGCTVAVTHGGVIKAAVTHALQAPIMSFWQIDVEPLSITELRAHDGRWSVNRTNVLSVPAKARA